MAALLAAVSIFVGPGMATLSFSSQASNVSYLNYNSPAYLSVLVSSTALTNLSSKTITAPSNYGLGLTSNSSLSATPTIFYYVDGTDCVIRGLTWPGGSHTTNITLGAWCSEPYGIWTNASGAAVTDFWIDNGGDARLYHVNATGAISSDPTGNFTVEVSGNENHGVWANISTAGVPDNFWVADSAHTTIRQYNRTGTLKATITVTGNCTDVYGITSNVTNATPTVLYITGYTKKGVCVINMTGSEKEFFNFTGMQVSQPDDVVIKYSSGTLYDIFVASRAQDKLMDYGLVNISIGRLLTNETGSMEYKTNYSSPLTINTQGSGWANFTWQNTSQSCNKIIGWIAEVNDTSGAKANSSTAVFYLNPFITSESLDSTLSSTKTCAGTSNVTFAYSGYGNGNVTVNMTIPTVDSVTECSYICSSCDRIRSVNYSDMCQVSMNFSNMVDGGTITIYPSVTVAPGIPGGLPSALAGAAVGTIILIYVVVRKAKRLSWS